MSLSVCNLPRESVDPSRAESNVAVAESRKIGLNDATSMSSVDQESRNDTSQHVRAADSIQADTKISERKLNDDAFLLQKAVTALLESMEGESCSDATRSARLTSQTSIDQLRNLLTVILKQANPNFDTPICSASKSDSVPLLHDTSPSLRSSISSTDTDEVSASDNLSSQRCRQATIDHQYMSSDVGLCPPNNSYCPSVRGSVAAFDSVLSLISTILSDVPRNTPNVSLFSLGVSGSSRNKDSGQIAGTNASQERSRGSASIPILFSQINSTARWATKSSEVDCCDSTASASSNKSLKSVTPEQEQFDANTSESNLTELSDSDNFSDSTSQLRETEFLLSFIQEIMENHKREMALFEHRVESTLDTMNKRITQLEQENYSLRISLNLKD
ncbi:hypothetical protein BKA69DRAFT_1128366 [Paraphysoderma sedebokerense]|nr:hypothetical protein BKA69DRAFT_1128366 [Paraphysoderma sedebokerense]